ncbi:MAG: nucleoside 2-deoxyribosyltransferase [Candidatus Saccharimonadales bacterium]
MKKVYFACSIAGGRDHAHVYSDIVEYIKNAGAEVLSELFADKNLVSEVGTDKSPEFIWKRDVSWVKEADYIVAEVTQPSLGVGYELGISEMLNVPILALFDDSSGRRLSPMVNGNPNLEVFTYREISETKEIISNFLV